MRNMDKEKFAKWLQLQISQADRQVKAFADLGMNAGVYPDHQVRRQEYAQAKARFEGVKRCLSDVAQEVALGRFDIP